MTMKKQLLIGTAATLIGISGGLTSAQAEDLTGWYGGVNLGRSNLKMNGGDLDGAFANQGLSTSSSLEKHDTGYSLDLGYQFNPYFALEGGYVDFGKFDVSSTASAPAADTINGRYKAHGYDFSAVGILPLQQGLSVYGKAGAFRSRAELDASSSGAVPVSGGSHSATHPTFGIGASYDFTQRVVGKLEWNRYLKVGDSGVTGRGDIDLYTAGVAFKF
jgi:OOP family OmpA-OmpF porin